MLLLVLFQIPPSHVCFKGSAKMSHDGDCSPTSPAGSDAQQVVGPTRSAPAGDDSVSPDLSPVWSDPPSSDGTEEDGR